MKLSLLLLATATFFITSCRKEKTPLEMLPPATREGKNSAGFLLDGQAWLPKDDNLSAAGPVGARRSGRSVSIYMEHNGNSDVRTSFSLYVPNIRQPGVFRLDQQVRITLGGYRNPAFGFFDQYGAFPNGWYFTGPDAVGELVITRFDTVARIVSGTFDMTVREERTGQSHHISHGRFDTTWW